MNRRADVSIGLKEIGIVIGIIVTLAGVVSWGDSRYYPLTNGNKLEGKIDKVDDKINSIMTGLGIKFIEKGASNDGK